MVSSTSLSSISLSSISHASESDSSGLASSGLDKRRHLVSMDWVDRSRQTDSDKVENVTSFNWMGLPEALRVVVLEKMSAIQLQSMVSVNRAMNRDVLYVSAQRFLDTLNDSIDELTARLNEPEEGELMASLRRVKSSPLIPNSSSFPSSSLKAIRRQVPQIGEVVVSQMRQLSIVRLAGLSLQLEHPGEGSDAPLSIFDPLRPGILVDTALELNTIDLLLDSPPGNMNTQFLTVALSRLFELDFPRLAFEAIDHIEARLPVGMGGTRFGDRVLESAAIRHIRQRQPSVAQQCVENIISRRIRGENPLRTISDRVMSGPGFIGNRGAMDTLFQVLAVAPERYRRPEVGRVTRNALSLFRCPLEWLKEAAIQNLASSDCAVAMGKMVDHLLLNRGFAAANHFAESIEGESVRSAIQARVGSSAARFIQASQSYTAVQQGLSRPMLPSRLSQVGSALEASDWVDDLSHLAISDGE